MSLVDYLSTLNLEPIVPYTEQTTRAISLNYLSSQFGAIPLPIIGNAAVKCINNTQRLALSTRGSPVESLCVDRELRRAHTSPKFTRRLWGVLGLCLLSVIIVILSKSSSLL